MASRYPIPYSSQRSLGTFDPLLDLHREMDRLFDTFVGGTGSLSTASPSAVAMPMPRIDVREDERELCVTADMPGVKPSEVDVRVEGDMLIISGERKAEVERKDENYHLMERGYGRFRRSVQLPFTPDPDQVHADCSQGVLTIRMPRKAQMESSRRIEVRESGGAAQQSQDVDVGTQPRSAGKDAGNKEAPGTAHH